MVTTYIHLQCSIKHVLSVCVPVSVTCPAKCAQPSSRVLSANPVNTISANTPSSISTRDLAFSAVVSVEGEGWASFTFLFRELRRTDFEDWELHTREKQAASPWLLNYVQSYRFIRLSHYRSLQFSPRKKIETLSMQLISSMQIVHSPSRGHSY